MPRPHFKAWPWCLVLSGLFALASGLRAEVDAVRIHDREYVSVFALGRQCGLASQWDAKRKVLTLVGANARIEFETDSREIHINGLRMFLCAPTVLHKKALYLDRIDRDRFLLPIFNPKRIAGPTPVLKTIVVDAGHGGKDEGTHNGHSGVMEKNAALDVARRLAAHLTTAGYRVVLTRDDDTFIPLPNRPAIANHEKADLFVSIHFNAIDNPAVAGNETFILTPQNQESTDPEKGSYRELVTTLLPGNRVDEWNAVLGYRMHRQILLQLKGFDRGLKRARWAVLRDLNCPGILVEGGYLSNDAESRKIATPEWREELAKAIAAGIASYRETLEIPRKK
jgi:N-acetylmuramoyl-L-alanine amidase